MQIIQEGRPQWMWKPQGLIYRRHFDPTFEYHIYKITTWLNLLRLGAYRVWLNSAPYYINNPTIVPEPIVWLMNPYIENLVDNGSQARMTLLDGEQSHIYSMSLNFLIKMWCAIHLFYCSKLMWWSIISTYNFFNSLHITLSLASVIWGKTY
jgi:hypothetical protein